MRVYHRWCLEEGKTCLNKVQEIFGWLVRAAMQKPSLPGEQSEVVLLLVGISS